jgi:hypothetical protein
MTQIGVYTDLKIRYLSKKNQYLDKYQARHRLMKFVEFPPKHSLS